MGKNGFKYAFFEKLLVMELSDYVGQPCKTQLAFEFFPKKPQSLDLQKVVGLLRKSTFVVELETPIFVGVLVGKTSVSIFRNGKIMVKDITKKEAAAEIAKKIVKAIAQ